MARAPKKSSSTLAFFIIIVPRDASELMVPRMEDLYAVVQERCTFYEVILQDDSGSTDHAPILKGLLERCPFMHFIRLNRTFGNEIGSYAELGQAIGDHVVIAPLGQDPMAQLLEVLDKCVHELSGYLIVKTGYVG